MHSKQNRLLDSKNEGTPPSFSEKSITTKEVRRDLGNTAFRNVNSEYYSQIGFGLSVYEDIDLAVILQAKASIDHNRTWSGVQLRVLVYVIDDGEIVASPVSSFDVIGAKQKLKEREVIRLAKLIVNATCIALAEEKVNPYLLRDKSVTLDILSEWSEYNRQKMVVIYA